MRTQKKEDIFRRTEWFRNDRFGLFIHWGLYAIPAAGEWMMSTERMTVEEYAPYFDQFDPVDFDPKTWAKLAKKAGMRYAVLTAKHHDGFCLFDSKLTDFKATNTKAGRDLVREFLDAFRAEGLKVGLYYSLLDWHHPDFPKYADAKHPMRGNPAYRDEKIDFDRYLEYMHGQVKELVTGYGKLDIMWFDFSYENMTGETWKGEQLVDMVRTYQPDIVLDNRLEGSSGALPWELCATMNNHWGYCSFDHTWKSSEMLIRKLVECVSKGGNMILNVGPDAKGNFPEESVKRLREIGAWMKKNGGSIYGCGISEFPKPEWGRYTQKGNHVYAHVYEEPLGALPLYGISPDRIRRVTMLADGSQVNRGEAWNTVLFPHIPFVNWGEDPVFTWPLPDRTDTVLDIELKEKPE